MLFGEAITVNVRPIRNTQIRPVGKVKTYCHVSRVYVTVKTCFEFDVQICWTLIQLVAAVPESLSDTLSSSTGHTRFLSYSTTPL
jgi:hypothetical protein